MTEEQLEESEENKMIFIWYYDVFLPAAVGSNAQYGPRVRYYKEYTAEITLYRTQRVAVSVKVEAFGLLIYDNCVDKWNYQYTQKEADPNGKIQAHCKENRGKYTYIPKGEAGAEERRKAVCGFTKAGLDKFTELVKFIKKRRNDDANNGNATAKLALKLLRKKNKIQSDTGEEVKPAAKKRRVVREAPALPPQDLLVDEED